MSAQTPLDHAHDAMDTTPEDDGARLRFYDTLAASELYLLLAEEADGDRIVPQIFDLEEGRFVLAFDRPDRLSDFTESPAPYAAMSGRALMRMLAGQDLGVGVNLGVAPSSILIPEAAIDWLAETLSQEAQESTAQLRGFAPPPALPEDFLQALDRKLASAAGLARRALLARATYGDGGQGTILAFVDAEPGAHAALVEAVQEVLAFSGLQAAMLDIAFLAPQDAALGPLERVALIFDLPQPAAAGLKAAPAPPGSDPDKPPKLR